MLYVIEKSGQTQHNLVNSYSLGCSETVGNLTDPSAAGALHRL